MYREKIIDKINHECLQKWEADNIKMWDIHFRKRKEVEKWEKNRLSTHNICTSCPLLQWKNSDLWRDFRNRVWARSEGTTWEIKDEREKDKEGEITRGQEKRGLLCMCINRVYDEVSFLCCVQWLGAKESGREREGRGEINGKLHALSWPIVQYGCYILKKAKMMQPNGGWTPRSFLLILRNHQ